MTATILKFGKITLMPAWVYRKNPTKHLRIGYIDCDIDE